MVSPQPPRDRSRPPYWPTNASYVRTEQTGERDGAGTVPYADDAWSGWWARANDGAEGKPHHARPMDEQHPQTNKGDVWGGRTWDDLPWQRGTDHLTPPLTRTARTSHAAQEPHPGTLATCTERAERDWWLRQPSPLRSCPRGPMYAAHRRKSENAYCWKQQRALSPSSWTRWDGCRNEKAWEPSGRI